MLGGLYVCGTLKLITFVTNMTNMIVKILCWVGLQINHANNICGICDICDKYDCQNLMLGGSPTPGSPSLSREPRLTHFTESKLIRLFSRY